MNSYAEVFEAVKEHCRVAVVDASFKLFIEPLELKCIEENTAIIYANNEWAKNVVEERFTGAIRKGFEKILGFTFHPDSLYLPDCLRWRRRRQQYSHGQ